MHAELPILSFLCSAILAVFLWIPRVRVNIANLTILSWLILCNVVHGINAILWAGNVNIHIPVWCDIGAQFEFCLWLTLIGMIVFAKHAVTKLLLGAAVAIPGACVCIARHLELVSSSRKFSADQHSTRLRTLVDLSLCYILPLFYICFRKSYADIRLLALILSSQTSLSKITGLISSMTWAALHPCTHLTLP